MAVCATKARCDFAQNYDGTRASGNADAPHSCKNVVPVHDACVTNGGAQPPQRRTAVLSLEVSKLSVEVKFVSVPLGRPSRILSTQRMLRGGWGEPLAPCPGQDHTPWSEQCTPPSTRNAQPRKDRTQDEVND
mmetsp:Transcript_53794/g.144024  ORF Transcript_53794/g.144024 Transcript_53794/m.144024 type:complete len:133 (-) Transcript_53794:706-1104(-)